jgi:hypothetical protein
MTKAKNFKDKINTKGFKELPENINKTGANRRLVSTVLKELEDKGVEQATAAQIKSSYLAFINLTKNELNEIQLDESQPMINRIVAKAILGNKGFEVIAQMLDRAIGKPENKTDLTSKGEKITEIDYSKLSEATLKEIVNAKHSKD